MRYLNAVLALSLAIALHEAGHLALAKLFGIRVHRFAIGFGPPLFSWRGRHTEYVVGAVPFGGSVRIHGMNPHDPEADPSDRTAYVAQPPWRRLMVLLAGSALNVLVGFGLLVVIHALGTHVPVPMTVGTVEPATEAARVQLRPGDVIAAVDGAPISAWSELVNVVGDNADRPLRLLVQRQGASFEVTVRPRSDETGVGRLGIGQQYVFREHTFQEACLQAVVHVRAILGEGFGLFWRALRGKRTTSISSPISMVKQASDAASTGLEAFLRVLVGLSIALAAFHLLPFPALDGGRMLFTALEGALGRRLNPRTETALHTAGFLALVALILWVAIADLRHVLFPSAQPLSAPSAGTGSANPPLPDSNAKSASP